MAYSYSYGLAITTLSSSRWPADELPWPQLQVTVDLDAEDRVQRPRRGSRPTAQAVSRAITICTVDIYLYVYIYIHIYVLKYVKPK